MTGLQSWDSFFKSEHFFGLEQRPAAPQFGILSELAVLVTNRCLV